MSTLLPDTKQRWWQLAAIQLAGTMSLPVILLSSTLLQRMTLSHLIIMIVIGNLILWGIGTCLVVMSDVKRLNIIEIGKIYLSRSGGILASLALLASSGAWFVIQLQVAISGMLQYLHVSEKNIGLFVLQLGVGLGVLIALLSLYGIKGIKWITSVAVLPLFGCLVYIAVTQSSASAVPVNNPDMLWKALPILLGIGLVATIDFPTFFRHSRSRRDSLIAISVIFIGSAIIQVLGAKIIGGWEAGDVFIGQQLGGPTGASWAFAVIFWIFAALLCVNLVNIYSASVGWELLFPMIIGKKEYLILAVAATIVFVLVPNYEILEVIGEGADVVLTSMGAVLILTYLSNRACRREMDSFSKVWGVIAWICGILFGLAGWGLIPYIDGPFAIALGGITSAILVLLGHLCRRFTGQSGDKISRT